MTLSGWDRIDAELDRWHRVGERPSLWWRDDDAVEPSAALDRLIGLSVGTGAPLGLAVIPEGMAAGLGEGLCHADSASLDVLQHGFAHRNHAPAGEKSAEFGDHRPLEEMCAEVALGVEQLRATFGPRFVPVFVPPWNRVSPGVASLLPELGFQALSAFASVAALARRGAEPRSAASSPILRVDTHLDIIAWRAGRGFVGCEPLMADFDQHLRWRRENGEFELPIGLLTHHLVHDADAWAFLDAFLATLVADSRVAVRRPRELLGSGSEAARS